MLSMQRTAGSAQANFGADAEAYDLELPAVLTSAAHNMKEFSGQRVLDFVPALRDLVQLMWLRRCASQDPRIRRYAQLSFNILSEVSFYFAEPWQLLVGYDQDRMKVFNVEEGHYKALERPAVLRSDHLVCMISRVCALCLGGYPASRAVYRLNLLKAEVTEAPSMLHIREDPGLIEHGRLVYAFGGYDGTHFLHSCEVFSLSSGKWTPLPDLLVPGCYFPPALLGADIYLPNYQHVQAFNLPAKAFRLIRLRPYLTSRPVLLPLEGELIFLTQEKQICRFRPSDASEVELQQGEVKADFPHFAIPTAVPVLRERVAIWVTRNDIKLARFRLDSLTVTIE